MSGNGGKTEPDSFSADYRGAFSPGGDRKRKGGSGPRGNGSASPGAAAGSGPLRAREDEDRDAPDDETEIDDFLPREDVRDDESLLKKWDDGMEDPPAAPEEPARRKRGGRHRYGILAGSLVLLLALVGVAYLATAVGTKIHAALTDDTELRAYDAFLTVVVAQDPQPFASPDKADPDFVLNASLWQTMTGEGAETYTDYDETGRTIVPLGDVVDACRDLFGPDCRLQPKSPAQETFFEYDAAKAQFHVALYSLDSTYVPYTESARRSGDSVRLRVGYIPPSDDTRAQSGASSAVSAVPRPVKHMEYVLKTDPATKKEYVYAVGAVSEG